MSSILYGPPLEENDVSGQVDKSIYTENQIYNSQTQRIEQTLKFFVAVRTRLKTASDSTKGISSESLPTPLDSYDLETCYNKFLIYYQLPLLKKPQTINSFFQHLQQNNANYL